MMNSPIRQNVVILLHVIWFYVSTQGGALQQKPPEWSCKTIREGSTVATRCTGLTDQTLQTALKQVEPDTTNLTITDSEITRLQNGGFNFTNLDSVTWILIGPCKITAVENSVFIGLQSLVYIFIRGNPFHYVPRTTDWSLQLPKLKELHITGSNIKFLEDKYFNGGTYEVLDLSWNRIEIVEDETFRSSPFIKYLDLSNNWLMTVSESSFYGLKNLKSLDISNNFQVFDTIYVSETPFLYLSKLESLNLANTSRKGELPDTLLSGLQQLQNLNLSGMHIEDFPEDVLEPVANLNLRSLDLSHNDIEEVKAADFEPFPTLTELYLSGSNIEKIERNSLLHLPKLNRLDLSANPYLDITGIGLSESKQLDYLNLRGLLMGTISDSFFKGLERLVRVDISNNNLTQITQECLYPVFQAEVILSNNPWLCDCFMLPLKAWILNEKLDYNITCSYPLDVRGQQLKNLKNSTLCRVPYIKDCCHEAVEAYDGNDVTVTCVAWGDPVPVVTWVILDGNPFPHNRTLLKDNNQTLVIKDIGMENFGNFSCIASNEMGNATKIFELTVLPSAVLEYAEIIAIACVCGIVVFALIWLGCFLLFKQSYFEYKPYIDDDDSHEERDYLIRGIQVRVCD